MAEATTDRLVDNLLEVARRVDHLVSFVADRHALTAQQVGLLRMLEEPISMRASQRTCRAIPPT